jgi:hypothetical protein
MSRRERLRPGLLPAVALAALAVAGCDAETVYYPVYGPPPYAPPPVACDAGIGSGAIDEDGLLDLEPGYGVGATVEYAPDGTWRIALSCDSLLTGYVCNWTVLVASIDGTIEDFEPEALELDGQDFIERYPTRSDSSEEDGVFLDALTGDGIDAFSVFATPGAGLAVSVDIDGYCAGPYLFWLDGGEVRSSRTNVTELFPQG